MADLIPTTSEAEWLAARRKGIAASEIAVVMGLSPYSSPYALYHQKLGILPPDDQAPEMEFGTFCEPYVVGKWAAAHHEFAVLGTGRELYAHPDRLWQLATPDRIVHGIAEVDACTCGADLQMHYGHDPHCGQELDRPVAVLETKIDNGSDEWGDEGTDEIPVHYRCQVLQQCDVMGVRRWHVACLGRDRKVRFYTGEVDEAAERDLKLMRAAARDFLDLLDCGEPPEVDWHPATGSALRALYHDEDGGDIRVRASLAISYAAAVRRFKAAERRKDEMTNAVLEVLRDKRRAIDPRTGEPIATRSVSYPKRVDVERLRSEQPAIAAEYTKPPKPEVKLTPAKPKKEKNVSPDSE
jgi:putative phage-type endonuclease